MCFLSIYTENSSLAYRCPFFCSKSGTIQGRESEKGTEKKRLACSKCKLCENETQFQKQGKTGRAAAGDTEPAAGGTGNRSGRVRSDPGQGSHGRPHKRKNHSRRQKTCTGSAGTMNKTGTGGAEHDTGAGERPADDKTPAIQPFFIGRRYPAIL